MEYLVTIVTVCFNEEKRIRNTIESVLKHSDDRVEYLIIDGGSQDSTLQVIKSYEEIFAEQNIKYRWISEPDKGIYNAMNKAINMAQGRYILNINIGDELLEVPYEILKENIVNDFVAISFPVRLSGEGIFYPRVSKELKKHNTLHHQGTFYKSKEVPLYNEEYKVYGDLDLNQQLYKNNNKILICTSPSVASHKNDGVSNDGRAKKEFFQIVKNNFGIRTVLASKIYFFKRGLLKKIRGYLLK